MRTFQDANGLSWGLAIDLATARRLRTEIGLDVFDVDALNAKLASIDAVDVFLALLKEQAAARWSAKGGGEIVELLLESLATCFDSAHDALVAELADFFEKLGRREVAELYRKTARVAEIVKAKASTVLASLDPEKLAEALLSEPETRGKQSPSSARSSDGTAEP